jgi:peptide/nickel transport system substrate-binding protein
MLSGRSLAGAGGISGGSNQTGPIFDDGLTSRTGVAGYEPRMAAAMPSVEAGTWKVNSDGTMDTTWKLRPNIKWHDGTDFTSADLLFGFKVRQDSPTRTTGGGRPELMESATAPDPATFVVHWKQLYVGAPETAVTSLPKHILEVPYQTLDREAFIALRYFRTDFVGTGPYKLTNWVQGTQIEGQAFDAYYLGRPAIDRVVVKFVPDPNTLIANALGEAVDVVLSDGIDVPTALEVRNRWAGTPHRVEFFELPGLVQLEVQHRPEFARPRGGLPLREVRQALYVALDRPALSDIMTGGVAPIADSWYSPSHPLRKDLEASIPKFDHDPARAKALFAQAGWAPGPDGVLVRDGERFETAIMGERGTGTERALSVISEQWRAAGVRADLDILTPGNQTDREYQSKRPGVYLTSPSGINFYDNRLHSNAITKADNRWSGTNRGGYENPRVDAILDRLQATIDARERVPLHRELLQEQMTDIALMPLSWEVFPALIRSGITGVTLDGNDGTAHIHQWKRP